MDSVYIASPCVLQRKSMTGVLRVNTIPQCNYLIKYGVAQTPTALEHWDMKRNEVPTTKGGVPQELVFGIDPRT